MEVVDGNRTKADTGTLGTFMTVGEKNVEGSSGSR